MEFTCVGLKTDYTRKITSQTSDNSDAMSSLAPCMDGFELCVLPGHVMLARLNEDFQLSQCSTILVRKM